MANINNRKGPTCPQALSPILVDHSTMCRESKSFPHSCHGESKRSSSCSTGFHGSVASSYPHDGRKRCVWNIKFFVFGKKLILCTRVSPDLNISSSVGTYSFSLCRRLTSATEGVFKGGWVEALAFPFLTMIIW